MVNVKSVASSLLAFSAQNPLQLDKGRKSVPLKPAFLSSPAFAGIDRTTKLFAVPDGKTDASALAKSDSKDRVILVGGGPRTSAQVVADADFVREHKDDFAAIKKLGGNYAGSTIVFERKPSDQVGMGNAFGPGHTGMVNTGVEGYFGIRDNGGTGTGDDVQTPFDYQTRFDRAFTEKRDENTAEAMKVNIPGAAMNDRVSTPEGKLDTSRATQTRANIGREEAQTFQAAVKELNAAGLYNVTVIGEASVDAVDLSNPILPRVNVTVDGKELSFPGDVVRLNTGTTVTNPIRDQAVLDHSFTEPMNPDRLEAFLDDKGLLDENGKLKPDAKILVGGTSLSSLDQLAALSRSMDLFEVDAESPTGYKVTEHAKETYQGALSLISRSPGKFCAPRHSMSPVWTPDTNPAGTSRELHALSLHKDGGELFSTWSAIEDATIARATGKTPDTIRPSFETTEELADYQWDQSKQYLTSYNSALALEKEARQEDAAGNSDKADELRSQAQEKRKEAEGTVFGVSRQVHLASILGIGQERDLGAAIEKMGEDAPHTFKGRIGYLNHRAQQSQITDPQSPHFGSNQNAMKVLGNRMTDVTASPVHIHSMFPMLMEAGILNHVAAPYGAVKAEETDGKPLNVNNQAFDAVVVSKTFDREAEPVIQSLAGQVQPILEDHPTFPEVGKQRDIITTDGENARVRDFGLGGKGFTVTTDEGERVTVGTYATDTNNRESGVEVAGPMAAIRAAASHLSAAGSNNPLGEIEMILDSIAPSKADFNAEVMTFEPDFKEAFSKANYLKLAEKVADGDAEVFARLFDSAETPESRAKAVSGLSAAGGDGIARLVAEYTENEARKPEFEPVSQERFNRRFVDVTPTEAKQVYEIAFERARERLDLN